MFVFLFAEGFTSGSELTVRTTGRWLHSDTPRPTKLKKENCSRRELEDDGSSGQHDSVWLITAMLCSLYTGHRWRRKQRNQPVGIRSESRVCVRACLCIIWSLGSLGRQHAPPQQVLAPRMQLGKAQFASASSCVRVAALAVGEVAPSLSAVQAGCLLPGERDVPGL